MMTRSIAAGAILMSAGLAAAQAAPGHLAAGTTVAATSPPLHPVAVSGRDDDATCNRARRRLWIAGEGWVVRRITTCR